MSDLNKTTAEHDVNFAGTFGNNSVRIFTYTLAAAAINDVVYLGKLPKYAYVHNVKLYNAALGAGTTVDVGYATADLMYGTLTADDNYWLSAIDTSSAAVTNSIATAVPKKFDEEIFVTATVEGGEATGVIYVVVEYLYEND